MKYVVAFTLFCIVAGLNTQPSVKIKRDFFRVLLDDKTQSIVDIHQNETNYVFSLKNMSHEFSLKGLQLVKDLNFQLPTDSCTLVKKAQTSFYCSSLNPLLPISSQYLKNGQQIHLMSFSSHPFRGKMFNHQSQQLENAIIYKTFFVLSKENKLFTFDFHTLKEVLPVRPVNNNEDSQPKPMGFARYFPKNKFYGKFF